MVDWPRVDTVFFDMDGTLLDLRFDNHFWQEHLPRRYAAMAGTPLEEVRAELSRRFRAAEGQLHWYCVDHWSQDLGVDIMALKSEVAHLISWRPLARELLAALRSASKRLVLVTNAHSKTLALKLARTALDQEFHAIVCAHDLELPKEHPDFWPRLARVEPFVPETTVLVDDSLPVLRAARAYGIGQTIAIRSPDSGLPPKDCGDFVSVDSFAELWPGAKSAGSHSHEGSRNR